LAPRMTACESPLISVVMPVYNRERYVAAAISSILAQTHSPLELIVVVDEGSSDGSAAIVRDFAGRDRRVRPLFLAHGSQWRARNAGVAMARGDYIAHMDDDDIALSERLSLQLAWMHRAGVDICGGSLKRFGAADGLIWFPESHKAICHELLFRISLFLPTVLMRAEIARAHPYDETLAYSDYAQLTQIAHRYRLGNMPQILLKCCYHENQTHMVHGAAFKQDQLRYSKPYFQTLFPEAAADDLRVISLLLEAAPFEEIADLERAGRWLIRLAHTGDNFLRRTMADRWRSACQRSSHLGPDCYRRYLLTLSEFAEARSGNDRMLRLACTLRVRAGSRWANWLKKGWHVARSIRASA